MKPKLFILADDLTGAADSAAAFASRGLTTSVSLAMNTECDAEIVAIDTETRAMSLPRAVQAITRIVEQLGSSAPLFKKVDSTLRGYFGPECAAALASYRQVVPGASLLVAPAFPSMARVTVGGQQFVNGKCVGNIEALLRRTGLTTVILDGRHTPPDKVDAWVCNAASDEDLRAWVAPHVLDRRPLLVGTAGLANVLANLFPRTTPLPRPVLSGPTLFVVGTAAAATRAQVDSLDQSVSRAASAQYLDGSSDAVICSREPGGNELDAHVSRSLARSLAPVLSRYAALFLTGGSTARAVLDTMGVKELRLLGELEPGVPVSVTKSGTVIVTKAGAFGDPATLERCRRALTL